LMTKTVTWGLEAWFWQEQWSIRNRT